MAPAQAPPFRLLTTVGLGTHDAGKSQLVVVSGA